MSGIGAVWCAGQAPVDRPQLARMAAAMARRGPHGSDAWSDGSVGLVHTHFWTTPEDDGERQPVSLPRNEFRITADARIDNRDELLPLLREHLNVGTVPSDASLILAAYAQWDEKCLDRLIGDFAFVIWDPRRRRLFAARDSFGVRPLLYAVNERMVVFGSTVRAVLAGLGTRPDINRSFISDHLRNDHSRWVHETAYQTIFRVPPAHRIVADHGRLSMRRYYTLGSGTAVRFRTESEHIDHFRELFERSVRARLRVIGPTGLQLSGGMDSSSVVCQANHFAVTGDAPTSLRTYSSVYPRLLDGQDESAYIRAVVERCQHVTSTRLPADDDWALQEFSEDDEDPPEEPDIGAYRSALFRRMRSATQDGCRVLLTGYEGDQVLSGWSPYYRPFMFRDLSWPRKRAEWRHFRRHQSAWRLLALSYAPLAGWKFRRQPTSGYLAPPRLETRAAEFSYRALLGGLPSARHSYLDWLAEHSGVELRFPYLDRRLVDYLIALPGDFRIRNGQPKYLLRRAMADLLPPLVRDRAFGFGADVAALRRTGIQREAPRLLGLLNRTRLAEAGFVDQQAGKNAVERAVAQPDRGFDHLRAFLSAELWLRRLLGG